MVQLISIAMNQVIFSAFMFLPKIFITFKYDPSQSRTSNPRSRFAPSQSSIVNVPKASHTSSEIRNSINVMLSVKTNDSIGKPSSCVDLPEIFPATATPYSVESVFSQDDVKTGYQTENKELSLDALKGPSENRDLPADAQEGASKNKDVPVDTQDDTTEKGNVPIDSQQAFTSQNLNLPENSKSDDNHMTEQVTKANDNEGSKVLHDDFTAQAREIANGTAQRSEPSHGTESGSEIWHGTESGSEIWLGAAKGKKTESTICFICCSRCPAIQQ
jgi:hypothetical protein